MFSFSGWDLPRYQALQPSIAGGQGLRSRGFSAAAAWKKIIIELRTGKLKAPSPFQSPKHLLNACSRKPSATQTRLVLSAVSVIARRQLLLMVSKNM